MNLIQYWWKPLVANAASNTGGHRHIIPSLLSRRRPIFDENPNNDASSRPSRSTRRRRTNMMDGCCGSCCGIVATDCYQQQLCPRETTTRAHLLVVPRGGSDGGNIEEESTTTTTTATSMTIRVRLPDGAQRKIYVPVAGKGNNDPTELTLLDVLSESLSNANIDWSNVVVSTPTSSTLDPSQALAILGLKHGSLLTLSTPKQSVDDASENAANNSQPRSTASFSKKQQSASVVVDDRFDPFPDLAKDYEMALRRVKHRRHKASAMSYTDIASIQSAMHVVEAQPTGTVQRVYMCRTSATRFQENSNNNNNSGSGDSPQRPRMGYLLGTLSRERKDIKPKARTSLSSTVESDQYCQVARVHAIWEPPPPPPVTAKSSQQQRTTTTSSTPSLPPNVRRVARALGLQPIGWIFAYQEDRSINDGLPVLGYDVQIGATLQIAEMKQVTTTKTDNDTTTAGASRFVTLAMDTRTGATEAFQLSDVAVQMVAEGMLILDDNTNSKTVEKKNAKEASSLSSQRYVPTKYPILVDGKETQQLDTVLCLVNTALLSHEGLYAGHRASSSIKKKTGALSNKTRKALVKALEATQSGNPAAATTATNGSDQQQLMEILCDFGVLLALDHELLTVSESEQLCQTVAKWARGQKKTVTLDAALRQRLQQALRS